MSRFLVITLQYYIILQVATLPQPCNKVVLLLVVHQPCYSGKQVYECECVSVSVCVCVCVCVYANFPI